LPQDDLGFTMVNDKGGRRLQSLVWDMDKNATDEFQCTWPKEMKLDSCIQPLPLVVKHEQQVTCSIFPYRSRGPALCPAVRISAPSPPRRLHC